MPVLNREMLGGKLGFRSSRLTQAWDLLAVDGQPGGLGKNYPHRPNADGGRGTIMRQSPASRSMLINQMPKEKRE